MEDKLVYTSVLPAIVIEFQDNTFLDVDDIEGYMISKTEENMPTGIASIDVKFGKRPWHEIKAITINGQPGKLVSFERHGYLFDVPDNYDEDDTVIPYDYAKMIVKYELSEEEVTDILYKRHFEFSFDEGEEEGNDKESADKGEDTGSVLQRSKNST